MSIITVKEFCEKYKCSISSIRRGAKEKMFPATKGGKDNRWEFEEADCLEWYNKNYHNGVRIFKSWDRNYFDNIDTPEKAYWLGFIVADGCIKTGSRTKIVSIDIGERDEEHLHKFAIALGSTPNEMLNYSIHPDTSNTLVHIQLCGDYFYQALYSLGLRERKSGKEVYIETDFDRDFIRGIFDGDGYIRQVGGIGLVGSRDLLLAVQQKLLYYLGIKPLGLYEHGKIFKICYYAKQDYLSILEWLYTDASVSLQRKHELANKLLEKIC